MPNGALLTISVPFFDFSLQRSNENSSKVLPISEVLQLVTYLAAYTLIFF